MNNFNYGTDLDELSRLFPYVREYQQLADRHNISDIFQDNGGKYLQLQIILGLTADGKREGNDAKDAQGNEYEIKTVNLDLQKQFTTHHHLNHTIIAKYKRVSWFFAIYRGIELQVIYLMTPEGMQKHYEKWETTLAQPGRLHINNPKVPMSDVIQNGRIVWLPAGVTSFTPPKRAGRLIEVDIEVGEEGC